MTHKEISEFYDSFLGSRMLDYRISGSNPRLDKAIRRIAETIRPGETLLDLGCGIGLVAEKVAARLNNSIAVWGCDISPKNIWYARKTVRLKGAHFFEADLLSDFDEIIRTVGRADLIALVDVIEHIPIARHPELFANIARVANPSARLVLTYPNPLYQLYLKETNPAELQIIDQCVDYHDLERLALAHGFGLRHYSLEDVWLRNQYVHVVFERNIKLDSTSPGRTGFNSRARVRLQSAFRAMFIYRFRRWKYVSRIFGRRATR